MMVAAPVPQVGYSQIPYQSPPLVSLLFFLWFSLDGRSSATTFATTRTSATSRKGATTQVKKSGLRTHYWEYEQ
jgi:hypothetical protein